MPITQRRRTGPFMEVVRWKLAQAGIGCYPTSDENWKGIRRLDGDVDRGPDAFLTPSAAKGASLKPTNKPGSNMAYGNRYWHDGNARCLSWWGSADRYLARMNFGSHRWQANMDPRPSQDALFTKQPTRYAETFYGDYFAIEVPLFVPANGPYQAFSVADASREEGGGTAAGYVKRPISGGLFYRGQEILTAVQADDYYQWSGAGILFSEKSGRWVVAVEQDRERIRKERVVIARLDGSEKRTLLELSFYIGTEPGGPRPYGEWFANWAPWNFSPNGWRAVAIRQNRKTPGEISTFSDNYTWEFWELSLHEDSNGNISATVEVLTERSPAPGDYYISVRGVERVNESVSNIGVESDGYSRLCPDYDADSTLRYIWRSFSWTRFDVDRRGVDVAYASIDHVDCRDEVLVCRVQARDGQRLVVNWRGAEIYNEQYLPLDSDLTLFEEGEDAFQFGGVPTLNGCAAVNAKGTLLVVSVPLLGYRAAQPWTMTPSGLLIVHDGVWYSDETRRFLTAAWSRNPQTGEITQVLDEAAIAELAGLPGETKVRLYPMAPL